MDAKVTTITGLIRLLERIALCGLLLGALGRAAASTSIPAVDGESLALRPASCAPVGKTLRTSHADLGWVNLARTLPCTRRDSIRPPAVEPPSPIFDAGVGVPSVIAEILPRTPPTLAPARPEASKILPGTRPAGIVPPANPDSKSDLDEKEKSLPKLQPRGMEPR